MLLYKYTVQACNVHSSLHVHVHRVFSSASCRKKSVRRIGSFVNTLLFPALVISLVFTYFRTNLSVVLEAGLFEHL